MWTVIALAGVTFAYLCRVTAPYGRHYAGTGWGPQLSNRIGWVVMELPATVIYAFIHFSGEAAWQLAPLVFPAMWQGHYLHRTFAYPLRTAVRRLSGEPQGADSGHYLTLETNR